MEIWYKTCWGEIEEVKVIKETEKFVTYEYAWGKDTHTRRVAKRCSDESYGQFFKAKKEAVNHILNVAKTKIKSAEARLKSAKKELATIEDKYSPRNRQNNTKGNSYA
jgi:hypothetical protein